MFMRFQGSGIGHMVSCKWDDFLQLDGHTLDEEEGEMTRNDVEEIGDNHEKEEEEEEEGEGEEGRRGRGGGEGGGW